jgi:hypothetical protein
VGDQAARRVTARAGLGVNDRSARNVRCWMETRSTQRSVKTTRMTP